jgi:hypothetical protein
MPLRTLLKQRCALTGLVQVAEPQLKSLDAADLASGEPLPEGYDTVPHWWATMEPEALEGLRDPIATFYNDAEALQTISEKRGIDFFWLAAGRAYREIGLFTVRAFPLWLLAEFYPLNP